MMQKWENNIEEKPDWDTFFMAEAFISSQRSIDSSTVHGAVWVSKDNRILSKGYNGPISGIKDTEVPQSRPDKYPWFIHAEDNAILNFYGSKSDTINSTIYVTGRPCSGCLRSIIQKGICKIVYGHVGSDCVDQKDLDIQEKMLKSSPHVELIRFNDIEKVTKLLNRTIKYIEHKMA